MIETARLSLRPVEAADIPHIQAFYASPRAEWVGGQQDAGRSWRTAAMFLGHRAVRGFGLFTAVRKDTDAPIGLIGPWFPGDWPDHEIGWQIWREEDCGHGFATEAGLAVRDWARASLGWTTIVSYIAPENAASIAVAERMGATRSTLPHPAGKPCLVYEHAA